MDSPPATPYKRHPDFWTRDKFFQLVETAPALHHSPLDFLQAPRQFRPQPSRNPEEFLGHGQAVRFRLQGGQPYGAAGASEERTLLAGPGERLSRHGHGGPAPRAEGDFPFTGIHSSLHRKSPRAKCESRISPWISSLGLKRTRITTSQSPCGPMDSRHACLLPGLSCRCVDTRAGGPIISPDGEVLGPRLAT